MTPTGATLDRFMQKVGRETSTGCRLWHGAQQSRGYGSFGWKHPDGKNRSYLVHRLAYELGVGPIPDGMTIDHLCLNKLCVNPEHMEVVTRSENAWRGQRDRVYIQHEIVPDLERHEKAREVAFAMQELIGSFFDRMGIEAVEGQTA